MFLLRDVFDYGYGEIARDRRQVARQRPPARRHAPGARSRSGGRGSSPRASDRDALADRFLAATRDGDLAGLEQLLADDVVLHGDGGGNAPALARPVSGRVRVARTLRAWVKAGERWGGFTLRPGELNGQPGAITLDADGRVISAMALEISGDRIRAVHSIVNPEKLGHLGELADLDALRRR